MFCTSSTLNNSNSSSSSSSAKVSHRAGVLACGLNVTPGSSPVSKLTSGIVHARCLHAIRHALGAAGSPS
jgi:hypothetical protein